MLARMHKHLLMPLTKLTTHRRCLYELRSGAHDGDNLQGVLFSLSPLRILRIESGRGLQRSASSSTLHKRCIVQNRLLQELRSIKPIVTAFNFGAEQKRVIPIIHRQAGKEKPIGLLSGSTQYVRCTLLEARVLPEIF